jgi:hypothetical protein
MLSLFRALIDRLKALFATTAAQEFEAEFLAHHAERKAELLRRAARYEEEGFLSLAAELRQQTEALNICQPLAAVLPAVEHLQAGRPADPSLLIGPARDATTQDHLPIAGAGKKTSR